MLKRTLVVSPAILLAALLPLTAHAASVSNGIVVGHGATYKYQSVQQAVDAVPSYNDRAITIRVAAGTYVGKVTIPATKPYITIEGASAGRTVLTAALNAASRLPNGRYVGTFNSASVAVYASHFTARNITFANSFGKGEQAVALQLAGREERLLNCKISGWQDTLLLRQGPDYIAHCTVTGADDFIFGDALAYISHCTIDAIGSGCITAASTPAQQPLGFVFSTCTIASNMHKQGVYLGRPWRPNAAVVWARCYFPRAVNPRFWQRWKPVDDPVNSRFNVYGCTGPGWLTARPVAWSKQAKVSSSNLRAGILGDWNVHGPQAPARYFGKIPLPRIPTRSTLITRFRRDVDTGGLWTSAIQHAINKLHRLGGGHLVIPPGVYATAPFYLRSGVDLHVARGALLRFTGNHAAFSLRHNRYENCLSAKDCHDIAITGHGIIDGSGASWWPEYRKTGPLHLPPHLPSRPYLVEFQRCLRVLVRDVRLQNSPSFHLVPSQCIDVTIKHLVVKAPANADNTDGMDPSGHHFRITYCTFDDGDDCIAIKPSAQGDVADPSCTDFYIANCTFLHGHGLSIGGQTPGGMTGLLVKNCTFIGTDAGIRMKAGRGFGGPVWGLTYRTINMKNVRFPILITSYYPSIPRDPLHDKILPVTRKTPIWTGINITDLTATGAERGIVIVGLPEQHVGGVKLRNVRISAHRASEIVFANDVQMNDCNIRVVRKR